MHPQQCLQSLAATSLSAKMNIDNGNFILGFFFLQQFDIYYL